LEIGLELLACWHAGISEMRNALQEKVQDKLKNKGKQRMRPKMGKMEIDYDLMQDAFFKKQQKPAMTRMGDLYYEGAAPCYGHHSCC
jgi:splicing factor 3B subunit 2